jgi:hypothetical protein
MVIASKRRMAKRRLLSLQQLPERATRDRQLAIVLANMGAAALRVENVRVYSWLLLGAK